MLGSAGSFPDTCGRLRWKRSIIAPHGANVTSWRIWGLKETCSQPGGGFGWRMVNSVSFWRVLPRPGPKWRCWLSEWKNFKAIIAKGVPPMFWLLCYFPERYWKPSFYPKPITTQAESVGVGWGKTGRTVACKSLFFQLLMLGFFLDDGKIRSQGLVH